MKSRRSEIEQRFLLLFKLDAKNLHNRIVNRRHEYVEAFSLKRNRSVFRDIFENRYIKASLKDLSFCTSEIIESLNSFYSLSDDLYWYLKHTQDMPNMIEDEIQRRVKAIGKSYSVLELFIDAELSGQSPDKVDDFSEISPLPDDNHNDSFQMDGEKTLEEEDREYLSPEPYTHDEYEDESEIEIN